MDTRNKLAVTIADDAISLAWVARDRSLVETRCWPIARFSTLTDALLTYEGEVGTTLRGALCAVGILGATHGDKIMLSRGSWAISRLGLRSVFRRDAIVLNDVAALAWAALGGTGARLHGLSAAAPAPDFHRRGRWTVSKISTGVGLAVIDVDETGAARVLECEMGHCGFSPATPEDRLLADALGRAGPVTWERVLSLLADDPIWAVPGLPTARSGRLGVLARLIGRFAGETVLAHGAWSGAIVTGNRVGDAVGEGGGAAVFNSGFEARTKFARLVQSAPRWRLTGQELTLAGCATALDLHPAALDVRQAA